MSEPTKIQLTDEQIKECKEHGISYERDLSKFLTKLIFDLIEEQSNRQDKFWNSLFLIAGVTKETHNLTINYIDKCLYVEPLEKER